MDAIALYFTLPIASSIERSLKISFSIKQRQATTAKNSKYTSY
ncbi:hypothetical protein [Nostoc sp.]